MNRRNKVLIGGAVGVLVIAGVAVAVASGGGGAGKKRAAAPTTTTTLAPTTTQPPPVAPLTGLPDPNRVALGRPALEVKVENTPAARPQSGIDQADVVYEEVVEGGITRFMAIFNSTAPDPIGPVRSVRAEDPDIVWPLGGIFAYSGGAQINVDSINAAPVHTVDETAAGSAMFRDSHRDAPHNLYAHGPALFALGGKPIPPPALFKYRPTGIASSGTGALNVHVGFMDGYDPTWAWDAGSGTWKRSLDGLPSLVASGAQIAPQNVIVQFTTYTGEGEGQTVGAGDAWIFSDGKITVGKWNRPDRNSPASYVDATGLPLFLTPGRTWVELVPVGSIVTFTPAPAPPPTTPTTVAPTTTTKKK